jgi:hypothetical protein
MPVKWTFTDLNDLAGRRWMVSRATGLSWLDAIRRGDIDCILCGEMCTDDGNGPRSVVLVGEMEPQKAKNRSLIVTLCEECGIKFKTLEDAAEQVVRFVDVCFEAKESTHH